MGFTQICFLIILMIPYITGQSLKCARLCAFIQFPFNSSISINACTTIEKNNSQCSVYVEIDHQKNLTTGRLSIEQCNTIPTRCMDTIVTLDNTLFTTIRYTCTENNCDVAFLNGLFSHLNGLDEIPQINTTIIKENISDLIYNSTLKAYNISCSNSKLCLNSDFCEANVGIYNTPNDTFGADNENPSCISRSRDRLLLNIKRNYGLNNTLTTEMIYRCNLPDCVDIQIAENIYARMQNYRLTPPANFSDVVSNENCTRASAGTSFLVLSNGLIIFTTMFLLSS
jgi:hypothetical protein